MTPCGHCGSILGTGPAQPGRLTLCHSCDVHSFARCRYCDVRIDPRNFVKDRDGLACLPCDDERDRESHHYMTTEY